MDLPPVASLDEWLVARRALLAQEKDLTRARDALNEARRGLPMVEVTKPYAFEGRSGTASLLDLFEGRRQLVVQHFMFDPTWSEGCPTCSADADSLGDLTHLHARDTTFVAVSRARFETIEPFRQRMGWTFPWYSSYGTEFNYDFHVTLDGERGSIEYNYCDVVDRGEKGTSELPGVSVFIRDGDRVFHTYSTYGRGTDLHNTAYLYLDLTPLGRQEGWGGSPDLHGQGQNWVRHHDRYGT
ncbi:MAG TPA: DUF899 domain-containing protein [Acidimicrobiales bacterium]|nr:DUF899 domain-containing protein [Acidimicrobiales bacterium]